MDTGWATYFFTRIRKLPTAGGSRETGLYFKKRLLRRMDAISYDHDAFGRVRRPRQDPLRPDLLTPFPTLFSGLR